MIHEFTEYKWLTKTSAAFDFDSSDDDFPEAYDPKKMLSCDAAASSPRLAAAKCSSQVPIDVKISLCAFLADKWETVRFPEI